MFNLLGSWRRKRGEQVPLSLDAAIRDAQASDPRVRNLALQHLGLCFLREIGEPHPIWAAASRHSKGPEIQQILQTAMTTDVAPANRAVAAASLGQLGDPAVLQTVVAWASIPAPQSASESEPDQDPYEADAARYLRECAVIAMSVLGEAASAAQEQNGDARETTRQVASHLEALLLSGFPEVRYQAAIGLLDVTGAEAEAALVRTLEVEQNSQVAAGLAEALAGMDPPGAHACTLLRARLADPNMPAATTFAAALGLAAARDPAAGPRLLQAATSTAERQYQGRALEALAVLGPQAPPDASSALQKLAKKMLLSGSTRVRCAYALARIDPTVGVPMLERLGHSRFAGVREAVHDARQGLETLANRE